jgi:hypothetical protein
VSKTAACIWFLPKAMTIRPTMSNKFAHDSQRAMQRSNWGPCHCNGACNSTHALASPRDRRHATDLAIKLAAPDLLSKPPGDDPAISTAVFRLDYSQTAGRPGAEVGSAVMRQGDVHEVVVPARPLSQKQIPVARPVDVVSHYSQAQFDAATHALSRGRTRACYHRRPFTSKADGICLLPTDCAR